MYHTTYITILYYLGPVPEVGGSIPLSWSSAEMDRAKNPFYSRTHTL